MSNLKKLHMVYEKHLTNYAQAGEYNWSPDRAPVVATLIVNSLAEGKRVDITGPAMRATTKELGIKHNHAAIMAYINAPEEQAKEQNQEQAKESLGTFPCAGGPQ